MTGKPSVRTFPPEAWAVRAAREFVTTSPNSHRVDSEVLALAVSELATNAVLHANTSFVVCVERVPRGVRVSVSDNNPSIPRIRDMDSALITGRGLAIVRSVSEHLQIDTVGNGKSIWFELRRPAHER